MREEKPKSPSQKSKSTKKNRWFWPAVYSSVAIVFVGMIWGFNAIIQKDSKETVDGTNEPNNGLVVETNAPTEVVKFPFDEEHLDNVVIIQEYYDTEADEADRENALLVFNQTYKTNTGISISVNDQPFEVLAAMSGTVEQVVVDHFQGGEVRITHADGMTTIYSSLTGIQVKEGDQVEQGQVLGTATSNEWNPQAGTHLLFEVQVDGVPINPRSKLGF